MNRFLLISNWKIFKENKVVNITGKNNIPNENCILFLGFPDKGMNSFNETRKIIFRGLQKIAENDKYKYIVIIGKTDNEFTHRYFNNIPNNIIYLFINNISFTHPIVKFLPMGSDWRSIDSFKYSNINNKDRPILCYCNYSLNTHNDRKIIKGYLKGKNFINFENMKTHHHYSISRNKFFKRLSDSKFVICPRGAAPDTFRFYDSIYAGAIPIIVKEKYHDEEYFYDIPILFLRSIKDFKSLTEEFLNEQYELLSPKLKNYYEGIDFNHFFKKLNNYLIDIPNNNIDTNTHI